ncbi:MAG TPA: tetratricopeptide repeat protein [Stellaceae bacterium]|nr:tetratricopeptide repeat protein [Stellaceae bacterium]
MRETKLLILSKRSASKDARSVLRGALLGLSLLAAIAATTPAWAEGEYGPAHAAQAVSDMRFGCMIYIHCPIDHGAYVTLQRAVAGDRDQQYELAKLLDRGDGLPRDQTAATGWYGRAAEQGHVPAALELNHRRHEGQAIEADEGKIAAALRSAVDAGDTEAMRALADMTIYGRGGPRNPQEALALLHRAADKGSALAEQDLADLYLLGAPGVPQDTREGFRWMAISARHGNLEAMEQLGSLYLHTSDSSLQDPAEAYRWLVRASLLDAARSQEALSTLLSEGAIVSGRTVIAPDPIQADMWFRIAARSPFHDNPSIRHSIEMNMTSAELEQAKTLAADWQPRPLAEVLAMTIDPPPVQGSAKRPWPPGLIGPALKVFQDGADNPEPWQRLPDFDHPDEVSAAITAIAGYCDRKGLDRCASFCRERLAELAPPEKPGGLTVDEIADRLRKNPGLSPVALMRKTPPTADEQMQGWTLCASRVADH